MSIREKVLTDVLLSEVLADPDFNCRGDINMFSCKDLAEDIKRNGLLSPPLLEPYAIDGYKFKCVAGHRRLMACTINGFKTIKAFVVTGLTREEAYVINLSENVSRQDLNILQEARALLRFEAIGWGREKIAKELGVSSGWIRIREKLLTLPDDVQEKAAAGLISQAQIDEIGKCMTPTLMREMARRAIDYKISEGSAIKLRKLKKDDPELQRTREIGEVHKMQDVIRETIGNNLATRVLGWVGGNVATSAVFADIAKLAKDSGKKFEMPDSLQQAHERVGG